MTLTLKQLRDVTARMMDDYPGWSDCKVLVQDRKSGVYRSITDITLSTEYSFQNGSRTYVRLD